MLAELLLYLAFLGSFGFIRTSAHMIRAQVSWWPGNVTVGGTHVHHLVWGICTMLVTGWLALSFAPGAPWREILAVLFGIGAGLTLDEFALWVNLEDVYWSERGRESIDAVIVAAAAGLVLLLGLRFWIGLEEDASGLLRYGLPGAWGLGLITGAVCLWRGHRLLAAVSLLVPFVGWAGLAAQGARTVRSATSRERSMRSATSVRDSAKRPRT